MRLGPSLKRIGRPGEVDTHGHASKQAMQHGILDVRGLNAPQSQRQRDAREQTVTRAQISAYAREGEIMQRDERKHDREGAHEQKRDDEDAEPERDLDERSACDQRIERRGAHSLSDERGPKLDRAGLMQQAERARDDDQAAIVDETELD